jgi:hypothetical protein
LTIILELFERRGKNPRMAAAKKPFVSGYISS